MFRVLQQEQRQKLLPFIQGDSGREVKIAGGYSIEEEEEDEDEEKKEESS
jgi:hypothetical protein